MLENRLATGVLPRIPLGSLQRSLRPPSWWEEGWLPPAKNPTPTLSRSGLELIKTLTFNVTEVSGKVALSTYLQCWKTVWQLGL